MSWLRDHLENFVKPVLGYIPEPQTHSAGSRFFSPQEMAVIKNMWRSVKRQAAGRPILLAGRDVWIFNILARRERFPVIFRPDISRLSVESVKEDYREHFLFDTGFAGSIPTLLHCDSYAMASDARNMMFTSKGRVFGRDTTSQVFPTHKGSRSLALKIEQTPKYWKRAFVRNGEIGQELSSPVEFDNAARLTIDIYKDSSPSFATTAEKAYDFAW